LTVGASTTLGTYLLPRLVGDFKKKHPSVEISFTIANTHLIEDMVLNHHIDIGLVEGPIYAKEIVVKHFSDDELYLICSQDHRWAREGRLTVGWEEVAKDTLILREKGSGTREIVEKLMARHNLACQSTHILNNNEAIKRAVEANLGIALLPQMAVHEDIRNGRLVKVNIKDTQIMRRFDIIYHLDKFRSPLFDAFMQYLEMGKFEDRGLTQT
jgi:DNA-binding transcriptional LysR family regulator